MSSKNLQLAIICMKAGKQMNITLSGELAMQNVNHKDYVVQPSATTQYLEMNQSSGGPHRFGMKSCGKQFPPIALIVSKSLIRF